MRKRLDKAGIRFRTGLLLREKNPAASLFSQARAEQDAVNSLKKSGSVSLAKSLRRGVVARRLASRIVSGRK